MNQPVNHNELETINSSTAFSFRKNMLSIIACLFLMAILSGCASTEVTNRERLVTEKLPNPGHIYIYDFTSTSADVPSDSSLAGKSEDQAHPQTSEQIALGRQLGASIATQLVQQINQMGLSAEKGDPSTKPQINDIVIRGYLISVEQGDATKRVVIGFGYGASELRTMIEGYQMTAKGLRKLGSAQLDAAGGKSPGGALGAVTFIAYANPVGLIVGGGIKAYQELSGSTKVEGMAKNTAQIISDQLKIRFKEEGWIN